VLHVARHVLHRRQLLHARERLLPGEYKMPLPHPLPHAAPDVGKANSIIQTGKTCSGTSSGCPKGYETCGRR